MTAAPATPSTARSPSATSTCSSCTIWWTTRSTPARSARTRWSPSSRSAARRNSAASASAKWKSGRWKLMARPTRCRKCSPSSRTTSPAAPRSTKRSCAATTPSKPAFRKASTCWSRKCVRSASTSTCTIPSRTGRGRRRKRPNKGNLHLPRLRGRSDPKGPGGGLRGDAPSLTLPRKRGREKSQRQRQRPTAVGKRRECDESRDHESFQPAGAGSGLRPDPDFDREPGKDYVVVLRRDQKAGNDQLPDLQTRARRPVLRAHLRADQGLRVLVRQVQAHEVQGHHLRE